MRIGIVTDTYVPDINGVANTLGRFCEGLVERGHEVEVIRSGKAITDRETSVLSWPLPGYWEIKVGAPLPGQLCRRWKKDRPDALYVAIETPLGFSAVRAAKKLGIPVVGGFHTNFHQYLDRYGVGWVGDMVWAYQKWFHRRMRATLVPSPDTRDALTREGFENLKVVGRGVDTELFRPTRRSQAFRDSAGAIDDTPIVLVVGRVSSEKNIDLAVRAFTRIREKRDDAVCVIVGDGPSRASLEKRYPDVRFLGYKLGEELAECYASSDILLFPSETETFGNVLLEGMASGLAVLSYDYAAAAWHGEDGRNLLKVDKGNEQAFLDATEKLLDPEMRKRLGDQAVETMQKTSWSSVIDELEKVFKEAVQN